MRIGIYRKGPSTSSDLKGLSVRGIDSYYSIEFLIGWREFGGF